RQTQRRTRLAERLARTDEHQNRTEYDYHQWTSVKTQLLNLTWHSLPPCKAMLHGRVSFTRSAVHLSLKGWHTLPSTWCGDSSRYIGNRNRIHHRPYDTGLGLGCSKRYCKDRQARLSSDHNCIGNKVQYCSGQLPSD